jgi:hypothetical protein
MTPLPILARPFPWETTPEGAFRATRRAFAEIVIEVADASVELLDELSVAESVAAALRYEHVTAAIVDDVQGAVMAPVRAATRRPFYQQALLPAIADSLPADRLI